MFLKAFCVALFAAFAVAFPAPAADLGVATPPDEVTSSYVLRKAVLLQIRATFGVVDEADIVDLLSQELLALQGTSPTEAAQRQLDRDLLMEGGYYLVSLRYLAETGGSAWPSDQPAATYDEAAVASLQVLEELLLDAVRMRADPLPIMAEAQRWLALTEGYDTVPEGLDYFASRDDYVQQATEAIRDEST